MPSAHLKQTNTDLRLFGETLRRMEESKLKIVRIGMEVDRTAEAAAKHKAAAAALLPSDHFQWSRNQNAYLVAMKESELSIAALHQARLEVAEAEMAHRRSLNVILNSSAVVLLTVGDLELYNLLAKGYGFQGAPVLMKKTDNKDLLRQVRAANLKYILSS